MIEGMLSWIMLIWGVATNNPLYFIASGVFAVAAQIYMIKESKNEEDNM
jgi:hypothetical protein